jgi:hypothetical protein
MVSEKPPDEPADRRLLGSRVVWLVPFEIEFGLHEEPVDVTGCPDVTRCGSQIQLFALYPPQPTLTCIRQ